MSQGATKSFAQRRLVADELAARFSRTGGFRDKVVYWRKRLLWDGSIWAVRGGKRAVDILGASVGLVFAFTGFFWSLRC